ncbi:MAG: alcohol dehydrogenase [Candidatus Eremiobacteraeota bacterium]|nr:alcohol dehydrogenase [Candidatus Eremiobacteraeota bacterium]
MRANCWHGKNKVRIEDKKEPTIVDPTDAIVKVTLCAICGSDLHLYNGFIPTMQDGDILGHEFMGEIVAVGSAVKNVAIGDRVVVAFPISCGSCFFCERKLFSDCERSNQNKDLAEKFWGHSPAGIYGYSHMLGGYAGGQSEYVRVPFADVDCLKVPENLSDEQVLFLGDIFPTGYMAAENCDIQKGDTIAVWGCGPVGQFAIRSAFMLGAGRVIAMDRFPERLAMATAGGAETIDYTQVDNINDTLKEMTAGRGPDACIDAVGMEAHTSHPVEGLYDRAKQAMKAETDRPFVLRDTMMSVRNGGTVSVVGVYSGFVDKIPFGSVMNRAVNVRTGQTPVQRYMRPLLERVQKGDIDPSFVITHRMSLDDAPKGYDMFDNKEDGCIKVVLRP